MDSFIEDMHIKVLQELESSDYVSTLRDPQEEQYPKTPYVSREIEDSVMNISIEATIKSITSLTFKVKPQSYSLRYFGRYI